MINLQYLVKMIYNVFKYNIKHYILIEQYFYIWFDNNINYNFADKRPRGNVNTHKIVSIRRHTHGGSCGIVALEKAQTAEIRNISILARYPCTCFICFMFERYCF